MTARLLIVDDVPANGRLLEATLTANYYISKFISDSSAVLSTVDEWEPDVILLDIMMPNVDGYEICRQLKSRPSSAHIPVILVTALSDQTDRRRGLAMGADEFLVKPVESDILLARLSGIIRLKQLLDEWRARGDSASALGLIRNRLLEAPAVPGSALIVDDLPSRSSWVRDVLTRSGVSCAIADGETASLLALTAQSFDLIIISLSLVSGDPLRLLAKLRASAKTRDTAILLIAEADQRENLINGLNLGANDCIAVPLDETELMLRSSSHIRRKQYQDRLRTDVENALELGAIDPLTQLFNRRYLMNALDRLCADPAGPEFALLMVDVDHFKSINDRFGHPIGDQVLMKIAEIISSSLRKSDVVSRYGGEEFVVVLTSVVDAHQAELVAEKLRSTVEEALFEHRSKVTVSVGVAVSSASMSAATLINAADQALYEAKNRGRNQVALYQADYSDNERRRKLES